MFSKLYRTRCPDCSDTNVSGEVRKFVVSDAVNQKSKGLPVKWAVLFVALLSIVPLAVWLRGSPQHIPKLWTVVGVLPFVIDPFHLYMAVVSWPTWPGFVKGAEISSLDIILFAIYLSLPRSRSPLPFRFTITAYFVAVLLSAIQAGVPTAALFYSRAVPAI